MDERREHPRRDVLTEAERDRVADVFTQHQRFVENVARLHAPAPDHVPDIVQAVAVQVCRGLNGYRGESELKTWLFRVTVNTARTYYRRERSQVLAPREAVLAQPMVEPIVDPDAQVAEAERADALHEAIDQLTPFHRNLMRNQLRGALVELGSKASRHRARRQLRQLLADDPRLEP